jgi:hypothetical protein
MSIPLSPKVAELLKADLTNCMNKDGTINLQKLTE